MFTDTILVLVPCKACDGTGNFGTCGNYLIICERCDGYQLTWVERGVLIP
jgi:hypothetical protein